MTMEATRNEAEERMGKTLESLRHDFSTIRTGRASLAILDGVRVEMLSDFRFERLQ